MNLCINVKKHSMPRYHTETNQHILENIFTELRWTILEHRFCVDSADPVAAATAAMFSTGPDDNPNHDKMVQLLQEPVRFDGPLRKINQQNYYVIKHRLTKYDAAIVEDEIRAGYMYVLVKKNTGVAVSFFYAGEGQDLSTMSSVKKWARWQHSDESWIIYDPNDGHIRGNIAGSMMD